MNGYQPTNKQVAEWKQRRAKGEAYWRIAAEYDVCYQTVSKYVNERYTLPVGKAYLEPLWWAYARKLAKTGISQAEIGRQLGRCKTSVRYALSPEVRAEDALNSKTYESYKRKRRGNRNTRPAAWRRGREIAREEWQVEGGDLREFYKKHGVLE